MRTTRASRTTAVTTTVLREIPLIGVLATRKYTMLGLNRMLGGLYWLLLPKSTGNRAGIPTNRVMPVTSLAVVLELGIFRNR